MIRAKHLLFVSAVLLCVYFTSVKCEDDYYQILGVPRDADDAQIKKAFKKLSLKYHPDKNRDNEERARQEFVKVATAYETLIDPERKDIYNKYGEEGLKRKDGGADPSGRPQGFDDMFNFFHGGHGQRFHFQQHHHYPQEEPHEDFWVQSDVFQITMENLATFYRRNEVWLILFYKSNDKDSKRYKDIFREIAEKFYGIVKVAGINCHEDAEDAICEDFLVYDIPKIKVFPANSRVEPFSYEGPIDFNSIAGFAVAQMESFVKLVTDSNYESFLNEDSDKTKVLLFTAKKTTPPLLKALSKEFKGRIVFGEIRQSSANLLNKFQIANFPTLLVLGDPENYSGVKYEGDFKKDQIAKFLREHSSATPSKRSTRGSSGELRELLLPVLRAGTCSPSDSNICLLAILSEREAAQSENMKQILRDLAPKYSNDPLSFFFVSSANIEYGSSFDGVNSFPSLFILKTKRGRYVKYEGDVEAEGIQTFVETVLSGTATFKNMRSPLTLVTQRFDTDL